MPGGNHDAQLVASAPSTEGGGSGGHGGRRSGAGRKPTSESRLRRAREEAGLSQGALADLVGLSNQQVSNIERGVTAMTVEQAYRFARALNRNPADVMPPDTKSAGVANGAPIRLRGISEPEAAPYAAPSDAPDDTSTLLAALAPGVRNAGLFVVRGRAMEHAGWLPGDVVAVDLDAVTPASGAIVCAQLFDWPARTAETIFRRHEAPFLLAETSDRALGRPLLLDDKVAIKGTAVGILRRI